MRREQREGGEGKQKLHQKTGDSERGEEKKWNGAKIGFSLPLPFRSLPPVAVITQENCLRRRFPKSPVEFVGKGKCGVRGE